ncbi:MULTISPECIES: 2OG-Fe(II) oxygenase [Alkalimonas]|uniref:2OG-Fe(II) oxygenase n=1 Tax=Alkalimonas mucilaginosa TaxID=3057676 RepID=A0ABU7JC52_9GAMM|nr:2OG-Fe(II) oxygenase [Alkalimonas sp. MEB004]MEE2023060.1 2OG-Fe(II) oxygenase [Alkalimonas sp. MEB004]
MTDFIEVYDDALSPAFCQQLIADFEQSAHKAPGRTGGGVDPSKKISTDLYLNEHAAYQQHLHTIIEATSNYAEQYFRKHHFALIGPIALTIRHPQTGQPVALTHDNFTEFGSDKVADYMRALFRIGAVQMQKYDAGKGNYNYWHSEVYPQQPHNEALHRALLFMFYLNDVEDGGQTEFYYQNKAIQPKTGRMVIAPAYFTHTHRGCIPVSNDKYILTSWILFQRAEYLYGSAG